MKIISEFFGTAFLIMIVVGSGIMASRLSQGNIALALLINALVTGLGLYVLILCLAPLSGAHFNPIVTLTEMLSKRLDKNQFILYFVAQMSGAYFGILLTHLMFDLALFQIATQPREGFALYFSEFIASFGLIMVVKLSRDKAAIAVAAFIAAGYWFTASSSFANPAVTASRIFTDTFCGIAPSGVIGFITAQLLGALLAYKITKKLN
ncbi:MAG: aquaporin [Bacteriovoracaceae bacterium]|nr:aquaporin [Bacteriovoracaceae bacterium]